MADEEKNANGNVMPATAVKRHSKDFQLPPDDLLHHAQGFATVSTAPWAYGKEQ